jgi:hypothetical protein
MNVLFGYAFAAFLLTADSDGISVNTLLTLCNYLVFPLLAVLWKQQLANKDAMWKRIDEHSARFTAQDETISEGKTELRITQAKLDASLDALLKPKELQQMLDNMKQEIENKLEKQRLEIKADMKMFVDAIRGGGEA